MGSSGQVQSRIIVGDAEKSRRFARSFLFAVQKNLTGLNWISRCVTMSHKQGVSWSTAMPALWLRKVGGIAKQANRAMSLELIKIQHGSGRNAECGSQHADVIEGNIALAPFDATNVRPGESTFERKALL